MGGWVYMMANRPHGVLYVGVTADLGRRIHQHRNGEGSAFCRKYGIDRLVWSERFERIEDAIAFEKRIKKWRRDWKIRLIEDMNPGWRDLYETIMH
ncbi:MAG: GIY-YIG nuclease family protein [Alphaproteobacteria bacterium]|nr:GIY-YIG nuclease family protein [Alphaproteobacteria bacterium]